MFKIEIIAVSRAKNGPHSDILNDYAKRIQWPLKIHEVESKIKNPSQMQQDECEKICKLLTSDSVKIIMDERGKTLTSRNFASVIDDYRVNHQGTIQFVIGGADGLTDTIRQQAHRKISFGQQTWPHMLARIMLLEQIYRAQQILSGHPYHRD